MVFSPDAQWRAEVLHLEQERSAFRVFRHGEFYADFVLNVPGRHNISNALACIIVCHHAGLTVQEMQQALRRFTGAKRRFEILGTSHGALVVDDYAHHPTEVAAVIKAAKEGWPSRRIVAVFQPHRYSRTKLLFEEFVQAFREADVVIITDIYAPPPEKPIANVSAAVLAERVRECNAPKNVYHIPRQEGCGALFAGLAHGAGSGLGDGRRAHLTGCP